MWNPGKSRREKFMWAVVTPFMYLLRRKARVASASPSFAVYLSSSSCGISPASNRTTISRGNFSNATATGVWVVKIQRVCTFSSSIPGCRRSSRVRRLE